MITSDAHESIQDAIGKVFPDVPWQRCQFHFSKNISEKVPKKYQAGIRAELQEMWNCDTIDRWRSKEAGFYHRRLQGCCWICHDVPGWRVRKCHDCYDASETSSEIFQDIEPHSAVKQRAETPFFCHRDLPKWKLAAAVDGFCFLERNDAVNARKAIFSPATYVALINSSTVTDLRQLAEEQQKLRAD